MTRSLLLAAWAAWLPWFGLRLGGGTDYPPVEKSWSIQIVATWGFTPLDEEAP